MNVRQATELLNSAEILRVTKHKENLEMMKGNFVTTKYNSGIIYNDSAYYFTLTKEQLSQIIGLKAKIMNIPLVDHLEFTYQRTVGEAAFRFTLLCNKKGISSKAIVR